MNDNDSQNCWRRSVDTEAVVGAMMIMTMKTASIALKVNLHRSDDSFTFSTAAIINIADMIQEMLDTAALITAAVNIIAGRYLSDKSTSVLL